MINLEYRKKKLSESKSIDINTGRNKIFKDLMIMDMQKRLENIEKENNKLREELEASLIKNEGYK